MSFATDVRAGRSDASDFEDYVEAWHDDAQEHLSLHDFLGMDFETYARVVVSRQALQQYVAELRSASAI